MTANLDVLCLGEALFDLLAPPGVSFAGARSLRLRPGGAAVNVALALAGGGLSVALAAVVGQDALGRALQVKVAATGVDTSRIVLGPDRTGLVFVERTEAGRRIVGYRQAGEAAPRLPAASWSARVLVITGLAPGEAHAASLAGAAEQGRRQGAVIVVDLNARPLLWAGRDASACDGVIGAADLVKGSAGDLAVMGLSPEALRARMRRDAILVVTDGAAAARAIGSFGEIARVPEPLAVLDTTGAGDAFTARLAADLLGAGERGDASFWEGALRRGHAAARAHLRGRKHRGTK
jgi:sugar/nucleoside kinase (ribokinase family)